MAIRVAIVDDYASSVGGVVNLVDKDPRFDCVVSTTRAEEFLAFLDNGGGVDVVVLDLRMPEVDGWDVLGELRKRSAAPRAVVFSAFFDLDAVLDARSLGAAAFVLKSETDRSLLAAIVHASASATFRSDVYPPSALDARAAERRAFATASVDPVKRLTPREFDVFRLVPTYLGGTKEIALRLGLAASTVEKHLASIQRKCGMNAGEVLRYALLRVGNTAPRRCWRNAPSPWASGEFPLATCPR